MISSNRLGMLIALSSLGTVAARADAEPVERPPEPSAEPRYAGVDVGHSPPRTAVIGSTEFDKQRIAAAQAKRERKALKLPNGLAKQNGE